MKFMNLKRQISILAILFIGFAIGVSTLAVKASSPSCVSPGSGWSTPTAAPTDGNPCPPLNTGSAFQEKTGSLQIDGNLGVVGNLVIATGTPIKGQVLTAVDSNGTVTWSDASGAGPSAPTKSYFSPDIVFYYDSNGGYNGPPVTFFFDTVATWTPAYVGTATTDAYPISGKNQFGLAFSGGGGAAPYIQLDTTKRHIWLQVYFVRSKSNATIGMVTDKASNSVNLFIKDDAGSFRRTLKLDSDETFVSMKGNNNVFDSSGGATYQAIIANN